MTGIDRRETAFAFEGARIAVHVATPARPPEVTVVVLGAIWSVTDHIRDVCARIAGEGHAAIAPCLFRGRGIPARDAPPEALAQAFLDFDDARCTRDVRAAIRHAEAGGFGFAPGRLVPWGFCLGGRFAHDVAATSDRVAGAINFYGRLRFARQDSKPFLPIELAGLIEVPYLGQFAEIDDIVPPSDVEELRELLAARGVPHEIAVYRGARHGFFDAGRAQDHHPEIAGQAWDRVRAFLAGIGR